ncbi:hypothetical protein FSP39_004727 [Pinctada imbricata]|uniref:Major facilitator superfamily (MFS) profile domain-containing protein n=1 Tax=Pinctada imbricata TaxID=66713 RepID=A0AA89BMW4_PINIB|nr:hypothetical protein FSP39_004727 [Pinctada imbricata]
MDEECHQKDVEKEPLLDEEHVTSLPPPPKTIPRSCYLICPVLLLQVFSYTIQQLVFVQYSYFIFTKTYFPNDTSNLTVLTQESTCARENSSEYEREAQSKIQALSSNLNIYVTLALAIPNIFSNLIIGSLSDVYGRKLFISIAMSGHFVKGVLLTLGTYFEINIYYFLLFSFIDGCTGSIMGTITAMLAFVADCTTPGKKRVIFITIIEMTLGLGALIGALVSGYIIKAFGYIIPNIFASGILALAVLIILCFLPETLNKKNKSPKGSLRKKSYDIIKFYIHRESHEDNRCLYVICIGVVICMGLCNHGRTNVETLYQLNTPFCWTSVLVGWYLAIRLASQTIAGVILLRLFMMCIPDELIAMFGAISSSGSFIMEALATSSVQLILVPVVGVGSMITGPIVKGFMSKITPSNKQGTLFAGIGFVEAMNNLLGTLAFNSIYSATVGSYKTLVFYIMACISGLAVILLLILKIVNSFGNGRVKMATETLDVPDMSSSSSSSGDVSASS